MDIIAERTLEIELPGQPGKHAIRVLLGRPEARDEVWVASYEIHGPGADELVKRELYGVDSLQALESALQLLPLELAAYQRRGHVTLDGQLGLGFCAPAEPGSADP